ncbi:F-box/kelch-repeat protein At3g23880-like [Lotus japonicus]|uniref:F-box/kelch-repeat protein At3g23880-like n=1 Tax=Lotus japonicus TaxID=34305 RepID=UPI00258C2291|nr:F-box/kelch-repeat protein At3g23880-like [Lotus japonicus]
MYKLTLMQTSTVHAVISLPLHSRMAYDNNNTVSYMPPLTEETTATSNPSSPLPFDLVVEILCRLPVKSLLQLRCVCKSWNSLISDSKFAKKHLRCSPKDFTRHHIILDHTLNQKSLISHLKSLIFHLKFDESVIMAYPLQSVFNAAVAATITLLEYPLNTQNLVDFIVGSCNGCILCLDIDQSSPLLWNPSTRRFKKLPSLENPLLEEEDCHYYTTYGFGYDHSTDRYKVVAVFCYECDDDEEDDDFYYKTQVKVHTLGTDSWRSIQEFPSGVAVFDTGKFVSGTLNWLADDSTNLNPVIVSFDLGKESYHEIFPPVTRELVLGLGVLRDCLCIISDPPDRFADIWLMKEYGNKDSWTKLFSMKMMEEVELLYPNLLHISEDGEVLLVQLREKLVLYNSRDATFKTPPIQDFDSFMDSAVYVESLISPCSL